LYVLSVNIPKTKNCTDSDLVKQGVHNPLLTFKTWICVQCEVMHCHVEKGIGSLVIQKVLKNGVRMCVIYQCEFMVSG